MAAALAAASGLVLNRWSVAGGDWVTSATSWPPLAGGRAIGVPGRDRLAAGMAELAAAPSGRDRRRRASGDRTRHGADPDVSGAAELRRAAGPLVILAAATVAGVVLSALVASGGRSSPVAGPAVGARSVALAWAVAVAAAFRLPRRVAVIAVVAGGIALRLAALAGPPTTSDDLYRYAWDARVQAAGIDPYANAPGSDRLIRLREPWLWPDAAGARRCTARGMHAYQPPGQRTIYPPWRGVVRGCLPPAGAGARDKTWQVAGLVTELGVLGLLPVALSRWHRDTRGSPFTPSARPGPRVVNNGHVDGLAVLLIISALAVAPGGGRGGGRGGRGVDRGRALVKLYPAVLVLALVGIEAVAATHRSPELVWWQPG